MERAVLVGLLLSVSLSSGTALALDRGRTLAQFHHTGWIAEDGAPSQVSALAQTADGYLWIGSARGLFRFDGVRFELYSPPPGVALPSDNVYALAADPGGGLWVSFRPSGIGYIEGGDLTLFERAEQVPAADVFVLACDPGGRLWAGTNDGLVLRSGSRWLQIGERWNLRRERVWSLFVDRGGTLWVGIGTTLAFLRPGSTRFEATAVRGGGIPAIAQSGDGAIWYADYDGSTRVLDAARQPLAAGPARLELGADILLFDRYDALWVIDYPGGLKRLANPRQAPAPVVETADGRNGYPASVLFQDREGSIWVGTAKGLDRFRYSHVVPVELPPGHYGLTLLAGADGEVWAGNSATSSLLHVRGGRGVAVPVPIARISSVYRTPDGVVWWGGQDGIVSQRGGSVERFGRPPGTTLDWVWEIAGADDGGLWIGYSDAGLFHFRGGVWTGRPPPADLLTRVPSATYHEPGGRLWLGYTENRAALLERGRVTNYTAEDGIDVGRIRVIRGRGPEIWFGGELGLAMFRSGRFHAVTGGGGERFRTVSGLVETADGALWLNELRGIVRIAPEEVGRLRADPRHPVAFERFDYLDGLPGAPQMNWTVSTAVEATDGRLWFATDDGLAVIDPAHLERNELPPPVSILSVETADRRWPAHRRVALPVGTRSLQVHYTALSLAIPERVAFRYRLVGVDRAWQDAGTRRDAFYTNLRPGSYTFRVKASNHDGVWNEAGAAVDLYVPPAFYQTTWFLAVCILLAAVLAWWIHRLRIGQVTARLERLHDERIDERTRIARELHDTLLQGHLSASMQLHVANANVPADSPAKPLLERVLRLMAEVSDEGRRALQGLRVASPADSSALEDALARIRDELAAGPEVDFRVFAEGRSRPLLPLARDEIYWIGREALVNAFRHAGASRVEVEVEYRWRQLRLRVRDDGRGIDPAVLHDGREGHWGVAGMRERAERIGGRLRVWSAPGKGTEVELSVRASVAFEGYQGRRRGDAPH
jgi:signal transduction histidine kinase/ligand-binding sensor domain-containing protein